MSKTPRIEIREPSRLHMQWDRQNPDVATPHSATSSAGRIHRKCNVDSGKQEAGSSTSAGR